MEKKKLSLEEAFAYVDSKMGDRDASKLKNVISTMAIEDIYYTEEFLSEMIKVEKGEKFSEQLRQEVIAKHKR